MDNNTMQYIKGCITKALTEIEISQKGNMSKVHSDITLNIARGYLSHILEIIDEVEQENKE